MKKLKFLFTTILLLCCVGNAKAVEVTIDGIKYDVIAKGKQAKVISGGNYSGNIVIPSEIIYNNVKCSVTSIGEDAFWYCSGLTSITIPNSVTSIGKNAFYKCSGLTSVTIPNSVTSIGHHAFYNCSGLTSITIPNSVTSIGVWPFKGTAWYNNQPDGIVYVGKVLYGYKGTMPENTSIIVEEGTLGIAGSAFRDCSGLTSVTIPNSVTSIGEDAFNGTAWYDNQPDGVVYAGKVLYGYKGTMPENTSIIVEEGTLSISGGAFRYCSGLTSITIPNSVTSIGEQAFYNCEGLKEVHINDIATWCSIDFGGSDANPLYYAHNLYLNNKLVTELVIPNGVTEIDDYAFNYCSGLTSITIPNSVTAIGDGAFLECSGLTSITIPNSVTSIGYNAFCWCKGLESIVVDPGNTKYDSRENCNAIIETESNTLLFGCKNTVIPNSVTSIGEYAFNGCSGLTSITIPNSVTSIGNYAFYNCTGLTSITIPNSVTSIGDYAFQSCTGLTSITIPNSVTSIGESAFEYCQNLKEVINLSNLHIVSGEESHGKVALNADEVITMPGGYREGDYIFTETDGVYALAKYIGTGTNWVLPESCNGNNYVIPANFFNGNSEITSITIPAAVTAIGENAFADCQALTEVHINDLAAWCNIDFANGSANPTNVAHNLYLNGELITELVIPSNITVIKNQAFRGCSKITSVTMHDGVTTLGQYAFNTCTGMTSAKLSAGLTVVSRGLFSGCTNLREVVIPDGIETIEPSSFYGCVLTSITIPAAVTNIADNAFNNCVTIAKVINCSKLDIVAGAASHGGVALYAEQVINGEIKDDFIFCIINGVNTLCGYQGDDIEITLPENYNGGNYAIGKEAFSDYSSLKSVTIPNSVTSIGENAFYGCSNLHSVTIGSGVLEIGNKAFNNPEKVIWLANTPPTGYANAEGKINYVSNNQFTNLRNVYVYPYLSSKLEVDGIIYVLNPAERTCDAIDCAYNSTAEKINIGETISYRNIEMTVKTVMPYACYGNSYIKEVEISNNGDIKEQAFYNCDNLQTVTVSNNGNIGEQAFYDCNNIKSVEITNIINIESNAFEGCSNLPNIVIPNSVESIGAYSFKGCTALNSVTLGENVTAINNNAFENCTNLQNIVIPNSVKSIGAYSFNGCTALNSVTLGDNVTTINDNAFENCSLLTEITIPASVTAIANNVFKGCSKLADVIIANSTNELSLGSNGSSPMFADCPLDSVYIGGNITYNTSSSYGYSPFYNNKSLRTIVFADKETNIYEREFDGCSALENITLGNGITEIGNYAFTGCIALPNIVIPNSVESIGAYSFKDCTALNSVTLGENVTAINNNAFESCTNLPNIVIPNSVTTLGAYSFKGCTALNNVTLGENVTTINDNAFENCSLLPKITIPASVTAIANNVFKGCSKLADVIIANSTNELSLGSNDSSPLFVDCPLDSVYVGAKLRYNTSPFYNNKSLRTVVFADKETDIYEREFDGCSALENITLGNGITNIGNYAFTGCIALPNIVIPNSVTTLGAYSFKGCTALNNVTLGEKVTTINDNTFENCSSLPEITIPATVTTIANNVFKGCSKLADVIIANRTNELSLGSNGSSPMFADCPLDSVYVGAKLRYNTSPFYNNKSLRTIVFGNKETNIYEREFAGCSALKNITLGNGITNIGNYAFENCSLLPEITIPAPIATVANNVFKGCSKLADVIIADRKKELSLGSNGSSPLFVDCPLDSVYIGGEITYNTSSEYGYSPFYRNTSLRSVVISDLATKVYTNEFYGCTALTDVIVGHNVNTIGDYAFSACSSLNAFTFGSSIEEIGKEAFSDCVKLTSITSYATIPPVCGTQALQDINVFDCSLYVPSGYAQAYQQAEQWKNFFFVDDPINIYTLTLVIDGEIYHSIKLPYNAKILMPEPTKEGYAFSGWIGAPETMPKEDITVEGTFTINNYSITYKIDGTETTESLTYGAELVIPEAPAKEGYTFNGWHISGGEKTEIANKINIKDNADAMLYTNAPCTNAQYGDQFTSWNVLFDGDANTFFHSEYGNKQTPDALDHYIRVDMGEGKEIGEFKFTYTTRYDKGGNVMGVSPKTIVVEGSNSANGFYTVIATLNNLSNAGSHTYTSDILGNADTKYRYIRYRVTENHSGQKDNNHPYFAISEFGMERIDYVYDTTLPQTMPAKDIVIVGTYTRNSYNVTYMVADEVYQTVAVEYGTKIPTPNIPETDGYTFNSWENVPETMPAEDIVIYANINTKSYNVTYIVDGKTEKTVPVAFGTKIPLLENTSNWQCETPINIKDNADAMLYTNAPCTNTSWGDQFTSWTVLFDDNTNTIFHSEYGNKQTPDGLDHYIRVDMGEGKNINKFKFTYTTRNLENNNNVSPKRIVVEGSNSANGSYTTIATLENLPSAKETVYTSEVMGSENTAYRYIRYRVIETHGNSKDNNHPYFAIAEFGMTSIEEVPASMPARDIIIAGKACTEVHTLTYVVDGKTYKTETVGCNAVITPLEAPVKEGYTFSGWSEIPEIMPAENITVTGTFTVNTYTVTYIVDGEIYKIESVVYNDEIPAVEEPEKEGYIFSGWSEIPETMPAEDITITGSFALDNTTAIDEVKGNSEIVVYDLNGNRILDTENLERGVYIINGIKVLVK